MLKKGSVTTKKNVKRGFNTFLYLKKARHKISPCPVLPESVAWTAENKRQYTIIQI